MDVVMCDEFKKFGTVHFNNIQHEIDFTSYARLQRKDDNNKRRI